MFEGAIPIVTGGSSDIGAAIVEWFLEEGAETVVTADPEDDRGESVADGGWTAH